MTTNDYAKSSEVQRWVFALLIVSALFTLLGRIAHVTSRDGHTPFLSANDRSRWAAARALVERGSFEIDEVIQHPGWDSIDKVSHRGRDGRQHYYSSKPPILSVVLAAETLVVQRLTAVTLGKQPFLVGRWVIAVTNVALLVVFWITACLAAQRWCQSTRGRIWVVACATWGTLLTTFGVTINNHLPAAAAVMVAFYALLRIWYDGQSRPVYFFLSGAGAAIAAACELPALALLVGVMTGLLWKSPRYTLLLALPPALLVAALFWGTNYAAHDSWRPPYAHRQAGEDWQGDNWYSYPGSYWFPETRKGVDRGEPSRPRYAFHCLVGHHGILSLTPVWCISLWGSWLLIRKWNWYAASLAIVGLTAVCLVFFIGLRPLGDRNYGGMTCGFRWTLWLEPLWLIALLPAADRMGESRWGRVLAWLLLGLSVFSATYPGNNPWTHPWLYQYWQWLGWI